MRFTGSISLAGRVLTRVEGDMNGVSGTEGGYYGEFVASFAEAADFDADALYRLDVDGGPSMGVHVMSSAGPGSVEGEAVFRSRGRSMGAWNGSRRESSVPDLKSGNPRPIPNRSRAKSLPVFVLRSPRVS